MPRYLVIRYDVTELSNEQIDALAMESIVQGEESEHHPDVAAVAVCRFCGDPEDDGGVEVKDHCSGGGGRACDKRQAVEDFGQSINGMSRDKIERIDVRRWVIRQYDGRMVLGADVQVALECAIREYYDLEVAS